jgi:hypothetical protein
VLPPIDRPTQVVSRDDYGAVQSDEIELQNKKKSGRYGLAIILVLILTLIGWAAWKIFPYIPGIPRYVKLESATYQRSAHVYRYENAGYDPNQAPLAPEWTSLVIDTKNHLATLETSTGKEIRINLGEPQLVNACENQFLVETYRLSIDLDLGNTTIQNPVLIVACEMWAVSEKVRPTRLVIKEGPIPEGNIFFTGMECHPQQEKCMSYAEALGDLSVTVIDAETKQALPDAHVVISSGLGIQEFNGSFKLPIYTAMQLEYQVSLSGYLTKTGQISNFYGTKLEIMYQGVVDPARGNGYIFDLPGNGQTVEYQIELAKE